jgi:hypothetical protein
LNHADIPGLVRQRRGHPRIDGHHASLMALPGSGWATT